MFYRDKIYGEFEITEPVLQDLMNSRAMARLRKINQYGTWVYFDPKFDTTRFSHSVGVFYICKKFGSSLEEQIAALIHDVSHTAFSHVVDFVFGSGEKQDWAENLEAEFVAKTDIPVILKKYGFDYQKIHNDKNKFSIFERPLPALCADRLDYFFHDAIIYGKISVEDAKKIFDDIIFTGQELAFMNREMAYFSAKKFMEMAEMWSSPIQSAMYRELAEAIKAAMTAGILTEDDLFTDDEAVMKKLHAANLPEIQSHLKYIGPDTIAIFDPEGVAIKTKVRFIDPPVILSGNTCQLSLLNSDFGREIDEFSKNLSNGFHVRLGLKSDIM
ncbi:MAG: HD domain-containing protein, partial [Patescibacteria group bacterium]